MVFSFTGLAYLSAFFMATVLVTRFFNYWRKDRTVVSKLFLFFTIPMAIFVFITALAGLFFADNTFVLKLTVFFSTFLQMLSCSIIGYLVSYVKFPKVSPWLGFSIIFILGIIATILTVLTPFTPFLEQDRAINWGSRPWADNLRVLVFLITFIPLGIIFIQEYKKSKDLYVKDKALVLGFIFLTGFAIGFSEFFLEGILSWPTVTSDILSGFVNSLFILYFFIGFRETPDKLS